MSGSERKENGFEAAITRRRLVGQTLKVGGALTILTSGGLFAACGGGEESEAAGTTAAATTSAGTTNTAATTEAATTAAETGTAEPKYGGTLVMGIQSNLDGFDPPRWATPVGGFTSLAVFDRLVEQAYDGNLEPSLIEDMPAVTNDGTLFTFTLKQGVKFHHGRELGSDDVKFSLERLLDPATAAGGAGYYTSFPIVGLADLLNEKSKTISGIKTPDPYTVTIEMEAPESALVPALSLFFAGIVPRDVVEEKGLEGFNFEPVGTGPFMVQEADPGKGFTIVKNPDYFKQGLPYLDGVTATVGVDPELSILRIQNGEQDLMGEPMPKAPYQQLSEDPELADRVKLGETRDVSYMTMDLEHPAMKDLKVRQAMALAVDKEHLVQLIGGRGNPATGGLFGPYGPFFQEGLSYPYDPEQAKQLLADAGFADGFKVDFWGRAYYPYKEIGEAVQQDLEAVGITVDVHQPANEALYAEILKYPPIIQENNWEQPYPHGSVMVDAAFTTAALSVGCCNFSEVSDPTIDALAKQGHMAQDEAEIVDVYKQIDTIVVKDQALWVPLFYPKRADFVSKRLVSSYRVPLDIGDAKRFVDYWIEE